MFWLIFVVVAVAAQNDSSLLEKIAYVVDSSTLTENIAATSNTTIIRLSTQDYNITQVISPSNQSETEALTLLTLVDTNDNVLDTDVVTENLGLLPTEVYLHEKDDIKTAIKNMEFYPKVSKKNMIKTSSEASNDDSDEATSVETTTTCEPNETTVSNEATSAEPTTTYQSMDSITLTTTENPTTIYKSLTPTTPTEATPMVQPEVLATTSEPVTDKSVETTTIWEPSENTVSYEATSAEPSTTYQPTETTVDSISLNTAEKPTPIYKSLTPATPTETTPMVQPEVLSTTSEPVTGKPEPISNSLTTTFDSAKRIDIPASVDVVNPTTINDLNVVTPAKPEVQKTTTSVPVISKPSPQAFYVSNGHGFTRYPYLQTDDYRSSLIFDMMSRFRMPQIYINTKPYIIKVPQAQIVET